MPARCATPRRRRTSARRSSGTTIAACRRSRWHINSPGRGSSGGFITFARSTCRTGPGRSVPLLWRFQKKFAGSGAHGDLSAHIIDMARFITGDEITEVVGSIAETFIKERDHRRLPARAAESPAGRPAAARKARAMSMTRCCSSRDSSKARSRASKPRASPPGTRTRTASRSTAKKVRSASTSRT